MNEKKHLEIVRKLRTILGLTMNPRKVPQFAEYFHIEAHIV